MKIFFGFPGDRRGNAAVEFALLLPVMLAILVGTVDVGFDVHSKLALQSAVNSGMLYAIQTQGQNLQTTKDVIKDELGKTPAVIEGVVTCKCSGTKQDCTGSCSSGMQRYLSVTATEKSDTSIFLPDMEFSSSFQIYTGKPS